MRYTTLFTLVFFFLGVSATNGQDLSNYKKEVFSKGKQKMPYRILLPKDFDASKTYPFVLILHGSGERGNDNESQLMHGADLFLKEKVRNKYPAIVVFPQCAEESYWSNMTMGEFDGKRVFVFNKRGKRTQAMRMLQKLVKHLRKVYNLDADRMYVGGLSMGGMGAFEVVRRKPKMFAAAFPICGGANPLTGKKLKRTNWWVFHGEEDGVVPISASKVMVEALVKKNIPVRYSWYSKVGHDSWHNAFAEPELLPWLFSQNK
ncbi:MAG: alpha/beta hydrolase-fold protein [Cellulophaga sp.]